MRRKLGADELLAGEREEDGARVGSGELGHGVAREVPTDDRRGLEDRALSRLEPIEPCGEKRMDRRRDRGLATAFGDNRDELLEEEGIAFGRLLDLRAGSGIDRPLGRELVEERCGLVAAQCVECDRRARPARALVMQLRPGEAEQEDWCLAAPAEDVLDQVEKRGLRPVHVLNADEERTIAGSVLEQPANLPEDLVVRVARNLAEQLAKRQKGDAVAIRDAACGEHVRVDARKKLPRETGLA